MIFWMILHLLRKLTSIAISRKALSEQKKHIIENYTAPSPGGNFTLFGKGGRSVKFEVMAAVKMTLLVEIIVS